MGNQKEPVSNQPTVPTGVNPEPGLVEMIKRKVCIRKRRKEVNPCPSNLLNGYCVKDFRAETRVS